MVDADIKLIVGDTARPIKVAPLWDDAKILFTEFAGASVDFTMHRPGATAAKVDHQPAQVVAVTEDGTEYAAFVYSPAAEDVDDAGTYRGPFRVTYSDGTQETFPPLTILISAV